MSAITLTGGNDPNYTLTLANGTLTIEKKTLTVTADDKSRKPGDPNPAFTVWYGGFIVGEGPGNLTTIPTATCAATQASPPGPYPILPAGGVDENYSFAYVNGVLTVRRVDQIITFNPLPKKAVGQSPFDLQVTATSGLPVAFTSSNPTVATVSGSTVTIVAAGITTITASQPGDTNWNPAPSVPQGLVVLAPTSDFVITAIRLDPEVPPIGSTFTAYVTVQNVGSKSASGGSLYGWANRADPAPAGTKGESSASIGTLAAGQSKPIKLSKLKAGTTTEVRTFRAFADATTRAAEIDETNNQATRTYRSGPWINTVTSTGVSGVTADLRITVTGSPTKYAVMDGAWDAGSADWKEIPTDGTTDISGRYIFQGQGDATATPLVGRHTLYVAVRNSALDLVSAPKSVTVTVVAPVVSRLTPSSGPAGSALVTLTGTAFGPSPGGVAKVEFAGVPALIQSWSNTSVRCIVPAAAPLGAVNVILTTSAGLPAAPRLFTVLPFWYGNWAGTFQDTADTAIGAGALEHGWMNGSTTAFPDGNMSLRLGTGEILTGSVNASVGNFALTGTGRDGSGSRDLALGRPSAAIGTVSGTYVATVEDQFDSRGLASVPKGMLLAGSQTGGTVTLRDAVTGEVLTGPLVGDVFVVFSAIRTIYGHVTSVNASGQVTAFEAAYDWADAASFGWGEISAGRSDGTAGVTRGTTLWNFNAEIASGPALLPATVTVGYSNAITVTVSDLGGVLHTTRGKIYHDPDGSGSTFVARETTLTVFGFWNGAVLDGGLEHQDLGVPFDSGDFTGTPR